eukprot:10917501-Ditylum_brightwellii.AAC.1
MAEQALKEIINAEDMSNMWQKIKLADKGKNNQCHFGQASGTLFTAPLLSQHFEWAENFLMPDQVLHEEYTNTEIDGITRLLLNHCKLEINNQSISEKITHGGLKGK